MAAGDGERWDRRYADRGTNDRAEPSAPDVLVAADLVDMVPTTGRALDVACGLGAQTIWLAQRGLRVTALDASARAIESLEERIRHFHPRLDEPSGGHDPFSHRVTAHVHDLDTGLPTDAVDLDVIVCQRFRDPDLYPVLVDRLTGGGLLVLTVLSEVGADSPGPFHAPRGELVDAFGELPVDVIHRVERDGQASIVARRT